MAFESTDTMLAPPELTRAEVRGRIVAAVAERDRGMEWAQLADAERGGWYTALVDQAIAWMAQTGESFSANDIRELLPDDLPAQGLMGSRFAHARKNLGLIRWVGYATSTKKNTHAKPVGIWIGVDHEEPA